MRKKNNNNNNNPYNLPGKFTWLYDTFKTISTRVARESAEVKTQNTNDFPPDDVINLINRKLRPEHRSLVYTTVTL